MKLKIKEYVHYDDDYPSWIKEVRTDKCNIIFERWEIHRASIVLPSGKIEIKFEDLKLYDKKNWGAIVELLEIQHYNDDESFWVRKFNTLYTEFLYPSSPPLGYTLAIHYIDLIPKDEFDEMVKDWSDKPTYRDYKKTVNYINDVLYEAGKIIIKLAQDYEKEIIKEMQKVEEEEEARKKFFTDLECYYPYVEEEEGQTSN